MTESTKRDPGKRTLGTVCRGVVFVLILLLLLNGVSGIVAVDPNDRIVEFYRQKPDTLDVVYIGSSNTHTSFIPLLTWERYGIASLCYSGSSQRLEAYKYMIEEARKTQPNALMIISVGVPTLSIQKELMHDLTDAMPFSKTKQRLVEQYGRYSDLSWQERLEFFIPFIRYHSRWDELNASDFAQPVSLYKGSYVKTGFMTHSENITERYTVTENRDLTNTLSQAALTELLDYCDQTGVKALFVNPPQAGRSEEMLAQTNTLFDMIRERGYPVLFLQAMVGDMHLDLAHDFFDNTHTNIHGAIKYTDYIAAYLLEHYGFPDRRGDETYSDFFEAFARYHADYLTPNVFSLELDGSLRDYDLAAADPLRIWRNDEGVEFTWTRTNGADGYAVFRRTNGDGSGWDCIAELGNDADRYTDTGAQRNTSYSYTVIPFGLAGGEKAWGNFDYRGLSVNAEE